jgi:FAD/FMN-containing dehydrogenase
MSSSRSPTAPRCRHVEQVLTRALALAFDAGVLSDAVVAQSGAQAKALWHLRFAVSEANKRAGPSVSHDTSVATADVPRFIAAVQGAAAERFPTAQPLFVGHVGDGNIHVILLFREGRSSGMRPIFAWLRA